MINEIMEITEFINEDDFVDVDITDASDAAYEVWAVGYNDDDVNTEMFISKFTNPDDAVDFADRLTITDVLHSDEEGFADCESTDEISRISVEIDTVTADEDDSLVNVGTIYKRDLWVDGDYGLDYAINESEIVVNLDSCDYEALFDGTILVKCQRMENFKVNDLVRIKFIEEPNSNICTFVIISKVLYGKEEYFKCDFEN